MASHFPPFSNDIPLVRLQENHIPVMVVHGDADRVAPVETSRAMVAQLKNLGVIHEFIEVPGGTHGDVVVSNLPRIFEFFGKHTRTP